MNEDFVTFEQAKKLKELGFNWKCNHYYHLYDEQDTLSTLSDYENSNKFDKIWSAPTLAQVQKWLRETKEIDVIVYIGFEENILKDKLKKVYVHYVRVQKPLDMDKIPKLETFDTYEEALSTGISKALELIENGEQ